MQPRHMIVLLREKPVKMIGNLVAQHQHGRAFDPECRSAAKVHDSCQTRPYRRLSPGQTRQQGARFIQHMMWQGVEQRDMRAKMIAFSRVVRAAQAICP